MWVEWGGGDIALAERLTTWHMRKWIYRESNAVFTVIILYLAILSYSAFFPLPHH